MVSQFGSLGYTIMGKTTDLTVVQKTIIDTLHKEGNQQTFIAKEAGCSQSAVSKHVNRKLSERKKMHNQQREPQPYEDWQAKLIQEFEWTSQGMDWSWDQGTKSTTHRCVKEFGYSCRQRRLTWAKEKKNWTVAQWSKVLFSDESKFCIRFGNQGPRVWRKGGEAHSPSYLKSSVKFQQSVMIWGAMSSMGYCQEENEKQETKQCRWAEGHCQRNLCFHTTSAVPQTDHLHATPNWGSN